jgi:hypothetical protein
VLAANNAAAVGRKVLPELMPCVLRNDEDLRGTFMAAMGSCGCGANVLHAPVKWVLMLG